MKCLHRVPYQVMIARRTEAFFTADIAVYWACALYAPVWLWCYIKYCLQYKLFSKCIGLQVLVKPLKISKRCHGYMVAEPLAMLRCSDFSVWVPVYMCHSCSVINSKHLMKWCWRGAFFRDYIWDGTELISKKYEVELWSQVHHCKSGVYWWGIN